MDERDRLFGPTGRQPGHPESIKFRRMMNRISEYATTMEGSIKNLCNDQQKAVEAAEEEYEAENPSVYASELFDMCSDVNADENSVALVPKSFEQEQQEMDRYHKILPQKYAEPTEEERERLEYLEDEIDYQKSDFENLIKNYSPLLFASLFIAIYSHFERYLINLCNDVRESESLSLKRNELRGQGIMSAIIYLRKVASLRVSDTEEEMVIIKLNKIRNTLVHDPGHNFHPKEVDDKLRSYFWIYDPFWDDLFGIEYDEDGEPIDEFGEPISEDGDIVYVDHMFSLSSIQKIVDTFVSFSNNIDEAWEEYFNRKQNPQLVKSKKHWDS